MGVKLLAGFSLVGRLLRHNAWLKTESLIAADLSDVSKSKTHATCTKKKKKKSVSTCASYDSLYLSKIVILDKPLRVQLLFLQNSTLRHIQFWKIMQNKIVSIKYVWLKMVRKLIADLNHCVELAAIKLKSILVLISCLTGKVWTVLKWMIWSVKWFRLLMKCFFSPCFSFFFLLCSYSHWL